MIFRSNKKNSYETKGRFLQRSFLFLYVSWFLLILFHLFIGTSWWLWNITTFIPPLFFIIISLIIFSMTVALRRAFTTPLFGALIIGSIFMISVSLRLSDLTLFPNPAQEPGEISIFNWNTEYWVEETSQEEFFDFLQEQNADVYHLQEVMARQSMNGLTETQLKESLLLLEQSFPEHEIIRSGELVTMTRLPIVAINEQSEHKYLRVDVTYNDQIISLYNVHIPVHIYLELLPNITEFLTDMNARFSWRAEEFSALEQDVLSNDSALIVSGDFNTASAMSGMRTLLSNLQDAAKQTGHWITTTWEIAGLRLWRIDYVLGSEHIDFATYQNIDTTKFSDHWGQLVTLNLEAI